jgi:hypothetical protein
LRPLHRNLFSQRLGRWSWLTSLPGCRARLESTRTSTGISAVYACLD